MKIENVTPILNVSNVPASIAWFESLGWCRGFTWNEHGGIDDSADSDIHGDATFASVCVDEVEIFLCKDAQGSRGGPVPRHVVGDDTGGVWMSWWMHAPAEVDEMHGLACKHGYDVDCAPRDEPWGVREFHLRHPDGHTFRVSSGTLEE